jgi:non-ribosomal peptide synthetase component E (peptide arylation enzyme)
MGQAWGKLTRHEDLKDLAVGEVLERSVRLCPDKEAIISGERRVTYAELNRLVDQFAAGLKTLGYQKGDRVAICLHNSLELVISFYALARLGIITVWVK